MAEEIQAETGRRNVSAAGIPIPVAAGPEHIRPGLEERLGSPGDPPYTRGIYATMYRGRPWTIRQLAGFGSAKDTNLRYRYLLERGATGINGVFDYPSLRAFDSDDPLAMPDVGRGGVAVDVVEDFEDLFQEIPLDEVSISLVSSQPIGAVPHFAMFLAVADRRGIDRGKLRGTSQNDFLMETCITIAPKALPPRASFRLECDLAEFCIKETPRWNPVSVTGYNYREAGADAVLESALTLAHGEAVAEELIGRGIEPATALSRISFFMNAHNDLFEEVAKYRATRRIWERIVRERLKVDDVAAAKFRFHVQTSGVTASARLPLLNVARSTVQGLAAVLGGAQSIHINGFDEALGIPTEEAATVALRTQQVLLFESGVARTADPLGGSYFVEYLTDEFEARVVERLDDIRNQGGVVAATETGWTHAEISRLAYAYQRGIDDGSIPFVGVNTNIESEEKEIDVFELPADTAEQQSRRLDSVRKSRDASKHSAAMAEVAKSAGTAINVMPSVIKAVASGATLGEIGSVFRDVFGVWQFPLW